MKLIHTVYGLLMLFLLAAVSQAQPVPPDRSIMQSDSTQLKSSLPDTAKYTLFGIEKYKYSTMGKYPGCKLYYLQKDDTLFNKKAPLWLPVADVFGVNILINTVDRYLFKYDYAQTSIATWKHNIKTGWEFDNDKLQMNFALHPLAGALYFNAARSNGYNFYQSIPFAFGGSLMWEYFGENTLPSYDDLINTTVSGVFIGEVTYRLSSCILDDHSTGAERVFREIGAGIINPVRGINRLLEGKTSRIATKEVYQQEPLNVRISAGSNRVNNGPRFGTGSPSEIASILVEYGDPFDILNRKPYDFFKIQAEFDFGPGRKNFDKAMCFGLLYGKNYQPGNIELLTGLFQHFDYYNNSDYELATLGFGPGAITRLQIGPNSSFNLDAHIAAVPFGGNSKLLTPTDTSSGRDYNYIGGAEGKFEATLNLFDRLRATAGAYGYWCHTWVGTKEDNLIGILTPKLVLRIVDNLSMGFEQFFYTSNRKLKSVPVVKKQDTEQRIFLQYEFKNCSRGE